MTQTYYETGGQITQGKLIVSGRRVFEQAVARFDDGPVSVIISAIANQRSHQQNRFWHGVVIPLFAEELGYDLDEMKDVLSLYLIPQEVTDITTGEMVKVPGHTSRLSTKQFNDMIERAQRLGASLNIYVPSPNEGAA